MYRVTSAHIQANNISIKEDNFTTKEAAGNHVNEIKAAILSADKNTKFEGNQNFIICSVSGQIFLEISIIQV